jgi:hypothetical protein
MDSVEEKLRKDVAAGVPANFRDWKASSDGGREWPVIQARLVRELVTGDAAPHGVQIVHATIVGRLDLAHARSRAGSECNALILEDCCLVGPDPASSQASTLAAVDDSTNDDEGTLVLDARHSHLGLLWLKQCRVDGIDLSSAVIGGDLILDGLRSLPRKRSCWIRAHGLRVGGAVSIANTRLRLPEELPRYWTADPGRYALDLDGARIGGGLSLRNGIQARGGVNIARATVGAGVSIFDGIYLTAALRGGECRDVALRAAYARLQGTVFLIGGHGVPRRFRAKGKLDFYGCHIGGGLALQGVQLTNAVSGQSASLDLTSAAITGALWLCSTYDENDDEIPFEAIAPIDLSSTVIGGRIAIAGSEAKPINTLNATGVKGHSNLSLWGSFAETCDFSGSVIDGDIDLGLDRDNELMKGGDPQPLVLDTTASGAEPGLKLLGASVGGAIKVAPDLKLLHRVQAAPFFRSADLLSYPGWRLAEACAWADDRSSAAILSFLYRPYLRGRKVRGLNSRIAYRRHRNSIVILNGDSRQIHGFNDRRAFILKRILGFHDRQRPVLEREEQVKEYLSLFCNYIWGEDGAFRIVGDSVQIRPAPEKRAWKAVAEVDYAAHRFRATFLIEPSGEVTMLDDEPLGEGVDRRIRYDPPLRWVTVDSDPTTVGWPAPPPEYFEFTPTSHGFRWEDVQTELRRSREDQFGPGHDLPRAEIDLRGLKAGLLNDGEGQNWGLEEDKWPEAGPKVWLRLSGFEYGRIDSRPSSAPRPGRTPIASHRLDGRSRTEFQKAAVGSPPRVGSGEGEPISPRERMEYRQHWLNAQYKRHPPTEGEYRPQPYEHLARVWRSAGHLENADDITIHKLELEKVRLPKPGLSMLGAVKHRVAQQGARLIQICFGFGLKPWRATGTLALWWLIGVLAFWGLLAADVLKVEALAVATAVAGEERVVIEEANTGAEIEEVPCGDHINELVYPLDVMIPLLDLHQESRCDVSTRYWGFGVAKGAYAIVGWLIISGFILTWSGVVRRQTER